MKLFVICICVLFSLQVYSKSTKIYGKIVDAKNQPVDAVNIYLDGSMDGTTSGEDGSFAFETSASGVVKLVVTTIGYKKLILEKDVSLLHHLALVLQVDVNTLKEVEITASSFQLKGSANLQKKNAVELVTLAGSEGDMNKALMSLPGTQSSGVDGKLEVRGGQSYESQVFIDDMHVMSPYTSMPENTASRVRYSPFIFDCISFSMGGFSPEYSQSLSSVQPLQTKDESDVSKTGFSLMSTGASIGGTKAWSKSSTSFEGSYTNMEPYMKLFNPSEKNEWNKFYNGATFSNQTRFKIGKNGVLKSFVNYGKTNFEKKVIDFSTDLSRMMHFNEHNLYANATYRNRLADGTRLFVGAAYSLNRKDIKEAVIANDSFYGKQEEAHLKAKAEKRFSYLYKLGVGIENYTRSYQMKYESDTIYTPSVHYDVTGAFVSNDFNLSDHLIFNLSSRLEYSSNIQKWAILPRVALNYQLKDFTFSGVAARYKQAPENDYLVYNGRLKDEKATQYVFSVQNSMNKYTFFRTEAYYKNYSHLLTGEKYSYSSEGYGYSRGVDVMFKSGFSTGKDQVLEYILGYSFNDSKRKYLSYMNEVVPPFITRHTASLVLNYTNIKQLKSIIGVTNRYASGRTYTDPNEIGELNRRTSFYHSLDVCWTFLPSPKVVIYASASNVLNRRNVYGYVYKELPGANGKYAGQAISANNLQFFFIGCFITLSKKAAYDVSKF